MFRKVISMLRSVISMIAGLFANKGTNQVKDHFKREEMVPSFYLPNGGGSFEGAQEARRKNRRNKIVRRNRGR